MMKTMPVRKRNIPEPLFYLLVYGAIFLVAVSGLFIMALLVDRDVRYIPDYERINLKDYMASVGGSFSAADYRVLLEQTGLGKDAVDLVVLSSGDPVYVLERYQNDFFRSWDYLCEQVGIVTSEEHLVGDNGYWVDAFYLADVRVGDILLTKGTHSMGWRHGHAAIVIDAREGITLEAVLWGLPSEFQYIDKWRSFPTFIQLRHRDKTLGAEAAAIAADKLHGLNYGILAGMISKNAENPRTTQCSHLPWYAYKRLGYDVDSNGGWLVLPKDIAASGDLEIVQIYGVDPSNLWK